MALGAVGFAPAPMSHFDNLYPTANYSPSCGDGAAVNCQADGTYHSFYIHSSVPSLFRTGLRAAFNDLGTTDIDTVELTWSDFNQTYDDVYIYGLQLGNFTAGRAICRYAVNTRVCNAWRMELDTEALPSGYEFAKALTYHEGLHTVGMTHGGNAAPAQTDTDADLGCLRTPVVSGSRFIGNHNINQINAFY
ncbi:hypothetical protein [Ornithinimicrobium sp. LYQ103]|uniref:hypothetical protein n=1 Tax=Ornithinimicrobium sp. LYQ103 TaxID=3378796 RepID=UPI0038529E7A